MLFIDGGETYTWFDVPNRMIMRHFEGTNVAYFDGHVKWKKGPHFANGVYTPSWSIANNPRLWLGN